VKIEPHAAAVNRITVNREEQAALTSELRLLFDLLDPGAMPVTGQLLAKLEGK
jgi:hypothetical protein